MSSYVKDDWKYSPLLTKGGIGTDWIWPVLPNLPEKRDWRSFCPFEVEQASVFVFCQGRLVNADLGSNEGQLEWEALFQETLPNDTILPQWLVQPAQEQFQGQSERLQIRIKPGVHLNAPVIILHLHEALASKTATLTRWHLTVEANAVLTLIEHHLDQSVETTESFCIGTGEIDLAQGACLEHQVLSCFSNETRALQINETILRKDSQYALTSIHQGGKAQRDHRVCRLVGDRAELQVNQIHWGAETQALDLHLEVRHQANQGKSQLLSRSLAADQARCSMTGKIVIEKNALANEAVLENKNLSLSQYAEINSRPQLEVFEKEVIACRHGSTHGHLDEDALFYLQSRGIDLVAAKQMLIEGFIAPLLTRLTPNFRTYVDDVLCLKN